MEDAERQPVGPLSACVDLGTNSALLLVARTNGGVAGGLEVLLEDLASVRLGSGLARAGALDPAARERAREACARFLDRARDLGVDPGRCVVTGTAVLRRARDGTAFARDLQADLGCAVRVLSEEDEARLGRLGVLGLQGHGAVLDVGGGSTELALPDGTLRSAPVGALTLTETFLGDGEGAADPSAWAALEAHVTEACTLFPEGSAAGMPVHLVGGTAPNLGCLELGLARFDHRAVEGRTVHAQEARRWSRVLAAEPLDARRARAVEAERASILAAGLACVAAALERVGARSARVNGRGLRHGVLLDPQLAGALGEPLG